MNHLSYRAAQPLKPTLKDAHVNRIFLWGKSDLSQNKLTNSITIALAAQRADNKKYVIKFCSVSLEIEILTFLDASSHLHMRVCPSVRRSVGPSVRRSVSPSVRQSVGPSVRNTFSQTRARRILCRLFGLVHLHTTSTKFWATPMLCYRIPFASAQTEKNLHWKHWSTNNIFLCKQQLNASLAIRWRQKDWPLAS